jgi:hypothetical protein
VKTHTGRKIRFFRTDDDREFLSLKGTLNHKGMEWEKSVSFAQDQDDVSERAMYSDRKSSYTAYLSKFIKTAVIEGTDGCLLFEQ